MRERSINREGGGGERRERVEWKKKEYVINGVDSKGKKEASSFPTP